jgi:hypothetical protein
MVPHKIDSFGEPWYLTKLILLEKKDTYGNMK